MDNQLNPAGRRLHPVLLFLLLLTVLALQLSAAAQKSFWEDEAWTAFQAVKSPAEIVQATARDRHPPLYFLTASAWSRLFGVEEVGLRSLSIIFTLASLGFVYVLTRKVSGPDAALVAAALLGFSPLLLTYGHTARYYSMAMLLSLGLVSTTLKYLETRKLVYLGLYILLGAALLYTSYPSLGVLLACNLWWLFNLRKNQPTLLPWLAANVLVGASFIPWLPVLTAQVQKDLVVQAPAASWGLEVFKRVGYLGYAFGLGETLSPLSPAAWLGVLILIGMAFLALRSTRGEALFPLLTFLCLLVVNIAISLIVVYPVSGWQGLPNRMLYGLPFVLIWLVSWIPLSRRIFNVFPVLLLGVYLLAGYNYFTGQEFIKPFLNVPWREIMQHVQHTSGAGETAVVCAPRSGDYACWYYAAHNGYKVYGPNNWQQIEDAGYQHVWWMRTNLGEPERESGGEVETIVMASGAYQLVNTENFARQSDSLRWLKTRFLGQNDYEYRLNLFHFERLQP